LILRRVDESEILAICRGDSGQVHELGYDPRGGSCDCEARTRCGHLYALQLVTVAPGGSLVLVPDLVMGATSNEKGGRWISVADVLRAYELEATRWMSERDGRLAAKTMDEPRDDRRRRAEPQPKSEDEE
jgi:hypothetical protein